MATILGLLLVVTVIANYLTTQLPNQMSVNDLNRGTLVQNQVGRLQALLRLVSQAGIPGAEVSQPISLGSDGAAPFAAADGGTISPAANSSSVSVGFTLLGPPSFLPPLGVVPGGNPGGCTVSPGAMSCGPHANPVWNFSSCPGGACSVTEGAHDNGTFEFGVNNSSITISGPGGVTDYVFVYGDYNTISVSGTGGFTLALVVVGVGDHVTVAAGHGASTMVITMVGSQDSVSQSCNGASCNVVVTIFGEYDSFWANPQGPPTYNATIWGFNVSDPSSKICPYGNLSGTDSVHTNGSGNYSVTYHNSGYTGPSNVNGWRAYWDGTSTTACPYFIQLPLHLVLANGPSSGFVVLLRNTYAPVADVAYEGGSVMFAQAGGYPVMVSPPVITLTRSTFSIWVPSLLGNTGVEAGIGTAGLVAHLVASQSLTFSPSTPFIIFPGSNVTLTITSAFAVAWTQYFSSNPAFARASVSCTGPSVACVGPYVPGGPAGTVTMTVPVTTVTVAITTFVMQLS